MVQISIPMYFGLWYDIRFFFFFFLGDSFYGDNNSGTIIQYATAFIYDISGIYGCTESH